MTTLFERRYTLIFGTTQIKNADAQGIALPSGGLQIQFKTKATLKKEPNTLDLRVTNLARATRSKYTGVNTIPVILSAGYPGNEGVVFQGDSRTIDQVDNGHAEFYTHFQCGDGEKAYRFANFSAGYGANTKVTDVIRACAKSLSLNTGNLEDVLSAADFRGNLLQFDRGFTAQGRAAATFDKLMRSAGYTWSIQSGALLILKDGKASQSKVILLNKSTGLIGSPDHAAPEKKGGKSILKARSLLQPGLRCGYIVRVEADGINGEFVIQQVEHQGDSHGAQWYTLIEATAR